VKERVPFQLKCCHPFYIFIIAWPKYVGNVYKNTIVFTRKVVLFDWTVYLMIGFTIELELEFLATGITP
jgi:hypothetical protein